MIYNFFYYLHLVCFLALIFSPLIFPLYILKKTFVIPLFVYIIWLTFGECPFNKFHADKNNKKPWLIKHLLHTYVDENMTDTTIHEITGCVFVGVVTACAYRFLIQK